MAEQKTLAQLIPGEAGEVKEICCACAMRRRLLDLGIIKGTKIECVHKSPYGDPAAYDIRGTIIALRNDDSVNVIIQ